MSMCWYQVVLLVDCMEAYSVKSVMDRVTVYDISVRRRVALWYYVTKCKSAVPLPSLTLSHADTYR